MNSIGELYYHRDCTEKQRFSDWQWVEQTSELKHPANSWGDTSTRHINNSVERNPNKQVYQSRSPNIDRNSYRQALPGGSPSIDRNPREQLDPERSFNDGRYPYTQVHPGRSPSIDGNLREQVDPERSFKNDRYPYRQVHPGRSPNIDRNPREQADPERSFNNGRYLYRQVHPDRSPSIDRKPREQVDPERSFDNDRNSYRQVHPGRSPSIDRDPREQVDPERSFNNYRNSYRQAHPGRSPSIDRNPREQIDPERSFKNNRYPYRQVHLGRSPSIDRNPSEQVDPERSFNNDRNYYEQVHPGRSPTIDRNPRERVDSERSFKNDRHPYRQVHPSRSPSIDRNPREQADSERSFNNDRNPYRQVHPGRSPSIDRNPREQVDSERSFNNDRYPYRLVHPGISPSIDRNPRKQVDPERSFNNDRNSHRQVHPGRSPSIDRNPREQVDPVRSYNNDRNSYRQVHPVWSPSIDRNPREQVDSERSFNNDRNYYRQVHHGRSPSIDRNPREQVDPIRSFNNDRNCNRQVHPLWSPSIDRNPREQVDAERSFNNDRNYYRQVHPGRSPNIDRNPRRQDLPDRSPGIDRNPHKQSLHGESYTIEKTPTGQANPGRSLNIDRNPSRQVHPGGSQSIDKNPSRHEHPDRYTSIDRNPYRQAFPDRSSTIDRNPSRQVRPGGCVKETLEDDLSKINARKDNKPKRDFNCERENNRFDPDTKSKWKIMDAKTKRDNDKLTAKNQVNLNEISVRNREVKDQVTKRQRTHAEHTQQPVLKCLEVHQKTQYERFRTPALSPSYQMISARMATMESKGLVNSTAIMMGKIGTENQIQQPPPKYPEKRQGTQKGRPQSSHAAKDDLSVIIRRDDSVDAGSMEYVKNYINKTSCGQFYPSGLNTETLKGELSKINVRGDNNAQSDFHTEGTENNLYDGVCSEKLITKSKQRRMRAQRKKENEMLATANQSNINEKSTRTATIKSKEVLNSTALIGKIQKMNPEKTNHNEASSVKTATIESKGAIGSAIAGTSTSQMQKPPPKFPVTQATTLDVRQQSPAAAKPDLSIMVRRDDGVAVDDVTAADISKKLTDQVLAAVLEGVCGLSMAFTAAGLVEEGYFLLRPSTEEAVKWLLGCDFGISNGVTLSAKKLDAHRATIWLPNNTGYRPFHSMKFIIAHNNHIKELKLPEWTLIRKDTLPHGERYLMSVPQEVPTGDVWLYYQAMQIHIRIFDSGVQQPKIKCECKAVCQIHALKNTLTDEQIDGPNHCEAADIDEGVDSNVPKALEQETVSEQTQHPTPKCERDQATQFEGLRRPVISPNEYSVMIQREDGVALDKAAATKINERLAGQILESLQGSKRSGNLNFTASGFVGAGFFLVRPSTEEAMIWLLGCDFGDWRGVPLTAKRLIGHVTTIWLPHSIGYLPLDPLKYIKTQNTREDLKLAEWTLMRKTTLPLGERLFVSIPVDLEIRDAWLDYQATQLHVRIFSYEHTQPEPDCTCVAVCPLHATRNLLGDQIYDDGNEQRRPAQLANLLPVKPPGNIKSRKQILKIYRKKMMKKMIILARKARERAKGRYTVRKHLTKEVKALKAKKIKEKRQLNHLKRQKVCQQRAKLRAAMKLKAEMEKRGIKE